MHSLRPSNSCRSVRTAVLVGSFCASAAAGAQGPAVASAPSFVLPVPTGRNGIGSTRFVVDATGERPLVVTAWYPADPRSERTRIAPYLREEAALRTMAAWGRNPGPMLLRHAGVVTHSQLDAPVVRRTLPVVVFSHGYLDQPSNYTALMEELASHGYVVFSVAHTGETMAVSLPNDRISSIFRAEGGVHVTPAAVLAEWTTEDSVATAVTTAATTAAAEARLRAYLGSLPASTAAVDRWADDVRRVVDDLHVRNVRDSGTHFAQRLDLQRVAVVGHSMGGVASAAFCARDARCGAAINLDGSPQYGDLIDHPSRAPFLMVYGSRPGRVGVSDVVYDKGANYWRAVVEGALHLNFGDWQYWPAGSPITSALGSISAAECTAVVHRLVREFLDHTLRRARAPLFIENVSLPLLSLTRRTGAPR